MHQIVLSGSSWANLARSARYANLATLALCSLQSAIEATISPLQINRKLKCRRGAARVEW